MYSRYCELRNGLKLKDANVASATGIPRSTFTDWKNGRSQPKKDKLQKIADFFGVSIEYLMTGGTQTAMKLTEEEQQLIWAYRKLNKAGKDMLLAQLHMISKEENFTKDTPLTAIS